MFLSKWAKNIVNHWNVYMKFDEMLWYSSIQSISNIKHDFENMKFSHARAGLKFDWQVNQSAHIYESGYFWWAIHNHKV